MNISDIISNPELLSGVQYTVGQIVMSLLLTGILSVSIYIIYKKTYSGVSFSKHFGMTLVLVSLVAAVIVMAISGNLALSLGMIGALSIVRFRSAIKDPRDIAFLFWSVSTGIVAGVFIYKLAIISHIVIASVIFFFARKKEEHRSFLIVLFGQQMKREDIDTLLQQVCSTVHVRLETIVQGDEQLHIEVQLKKKKETFGVSELVKQLGTVSGVQKVTAVSEEETLGTV